ncbi:hypothetical protein P3T76_007019 [Phytophthora citrophthora]|uniref:Uncharacterized protein n=1 Tax=Phytophthora citrophthora TaxID=4793 RepID=A0AAD9LLD1_9STRA|nr:hypothetical protein P3T76_007019 [Phytophthora citrophthora]
MGLLLAAGGAEVYVDAGPSLNVKGYNRSSAGLMLNNHLVRASADQMNFNVVTPGAAVPSKAVVLNSNGNAAGINHLSAEQLMGTLTTAEQPHIESVAKLDIASCISGVDGLRLACTLVTATAEELNYVDTTTGVAVPSKAVVVDDGYSIANLNAIKAAELTGTVKTGAQPGVSSVGTLDALDLAGPLMGLADLSINTTEGGRTLVVNSDVGNCAPLYYDATASQDNYVDILVNSAEHLQLASSSGNVEITTHDGGSSSAMNYLHGASTGSAAADKALVADANRTIGNIATLTADKLVTLLTAAQPNVAAVNALDVTTHNASTLGLKLGGKLVTASADEPSYLDTAACGAVEPQKARVTDADTSIARLTEVKAAKLSGTIQTAAQPLVTSVGQLTALSVAGDVTARASCWACCRRPRSRTSSMSRRWTLPATTAVSKGLRLGGELVTVTAAKLNSIFSGSGGTFDNLSVSGSLTLTSADELNKVLVLGSRLVTSTADELIFVNTVTPGTAAAGKALVLDSSKAITGINSLTVGPIGLNTGPADKTLVVKKVTTGVTPSRYRCDFATSPSLRMTIATGSSNYNSGTSYAVVLDGTTRYRSTAGSFNSISTQNFGIAFNWQPELSRFVYHFTQGDASMLTYILFYVTSTNGVTWSNPASCGISVNRGTTISYVKASGHYVFFSTSNFWFSTNGVSWSAKSFSKGVASTNHSVVSMQLMKNRVMHKAATDTAEFVNVAEWDGTTWNFNTLSSTLFPPLRAYSHAEDRLYMLPATVATGMLTLSYINNFSTIASLTDAVQTVTFPNTQGIERASMVYLANFDIAVAGTKNNDTSSVRLLLFKNKQVLFDMADGPVKSGNSRSYRLCNGYSELYSAQIFINANGTLVIPLITDTGCTALAVCLSQASFFWFPHPIRRCHGERGGVRRAELCHSWLRPPPPPPPP